MNLSAEESSARARLYAFYLLKFRNRSQYEIETKLKEKKYSDGIIEQTIDYLKKARFIDDRRFARDWIKARLNKPFGLKRISFELKHKGVDEEIIQGAVNEIKDTFLEEALVLSLAQKQTAKYGNIEPLKVKQRLFGFLSRRGFSMEAIQKAIQKI